VVVWASNFTLYTSNSAEGRSYKQTQSRWSRRGSPYKQTQFAPAGWAGEALARGYCAKQTQFPATPGGTRSGPRGANAQNKPNFGQPGPLYKQTQFGGGQMCETNPIRLVRPGGTGAAGRGVLYKQTQFLRYANPEIGVPRRAVLRQRLVARCRSGNKANPPGGAGLSCTNKPNLAGRTEARRGKCAKRTQFRPGRA
jgi:hypothetical protein